MRQVVLDTETTGIGEGHRIIEIGCVEVIERKLTGRHFHVSSTLIELLMPKLSKFTGLLMNG